MNTSHYSSTTVDLSLTPTRRCKSLGNGNTCKWSSDAVDNTGGLKLCCGQYYRFQLTDAVDNIIAFSWCCGQYDRVQMMWTMLPRPNDAVDNVVASNMSLS